MKRLWNRAKDAFFCLVVLLSAPAFVLANVIVDRSGTVTTAATSQQAVPASTSRTYLMCQNPITANETLFVSVDTPASTTAGSYELGPGGSVTWQDAFVPTGAVFVTAATAGHRYICKAG